MNRCLKDRYPRIERGFAEYGPSVLFLSAGIAFITLSFKGVVEFSQIFWLVPASTFSALVFLVLAWLAVEVLFWGICHMLYVVCGMLEKWELLKQRGSAFTVVEHYLDVLNVTILLVLFVSFAFFLFR